MRIATFIVTAVAFGVGCIFLYFFVLVGRGALIVHRPGIGLPELTEFCLAHRFWLLLMPLPFFSWVALSLRQGKPSADQVALFLSVVALLFIALLFFVVIAMLLPWALLVEVFGD